MVTFIPDMQNVHIKDTENQHIHTCTVGEKSGCKKIDVNQKSDCFTDTEQRFHTSRWKHLEGGMGGVIHKSVRDERNIPTGRNAQTDTI